MSTSLVPGAALVETNAALEKPSSKFEGPASAVSSPDTTPSNRNSDFSDALHRDTNAKNAPAPHQIITEYQLPASMARALESPAQVAGVFGPVATGKTLGVCLYVYAHCKKYSALLPGHTIRWLFVRDTYESLRNTSLKTWKELYPDPKFGTWNEQKKQYTIRLPKNQKAEVLFFGMDDEKDKAKLLSLDLSGFVIDEPAGGVDETGRVARGIAEGIYLSLLTRLRHPITLRRKRALLVGNPPSTAHWVARLVKAPSLNGARDIVCVDIPREEAPILRVDPEYYEREEARWREMGYGAEHPMVRRYYRGEWLPALTGGFTWDMIPEVQREDLPKFERVVATLDPSTGVKAGDFSALCVAGVTEDATAVVLDLRVGRFHAEELVAEIYSAVRRHGPELFGFEAVAFQSWLEALLNQERENPVSEYRDIVVPAQKLNRDSRIAKESRIQNALGFRLAEKRLRRVAGLDPGALAEWRKELEAFPEGDHDDVLDALADIDQVLGLTPGPLRSWGGPPRVKASDDQEQASAAARELAGIVRQQGMYWPGAR